MVAEVTLCVIMNQDRLLLKKATRGISKGKWNSPGGKIESGETPEQNVIREVFEETGLKMKKPFYHGVMKFYNQGSSNVEVIMHLFSTKEFSGTAKSTDEGEVKLIEIGKLPYKEMWADDAYWMRHVLDGKRFDADFYFDKKNERILKHEIKVRD